MVKRTLQMPRACPVELHASSYTKPKPNSSDATGLSRGASRSLLFSGEREPSTAQGRGIQSCWWMDWCSGQRESPRGKPVAVVIENVTRFTIPSLSAVYCRTRFPFRVTV